MFKKLDSAIAFAAIAHAGQVRKFTGLPYILHPLAVMEILHAHAAIVTEDELIAAVLHDVVEDTQVTIKDVERRFGSTVAGLVFDLTDQFMDPKLGNRRERKEKERARLATISPQAQSIKYADLIHNTTSIVPNDPDFARVYLKEKAALLEVMTEGDEILYRLVHESLQAGQAALVQHALEKADEHTPSRSPAAAA